MKNPLTILLLSCLLATDLLAQSLAEIEAIPFSTWEEARQLDPSKVMALLVMGDAPLSDSISQFENLRRIRFYQTGEMALNPELAKLKSFASLVEVQIIGAPISEIPSGLTELTQLRALVISGASNLKSLDALTQLKNLEKLHLGHRLSGGCGLKDFPLAVTKLPKLTDLSLRDNPDLKIEDDFYQMSKLTSLDVSHVLGYNPHKIYRFMSGLRRLVMDGFPDPDLEGIGEMTNLEELTIEKSDHLKSLSKEMPKLTKLKRLTLPLNQDLDAIANFVMLAKMSSIEYLKINVANAYFNPRFNFPKFGFAGMSSLRIESNKSKSLLNLVVGKLPYYKSLTHLELVNFTATEIPEQLFLLTKLTGLHFYDVKVGEIPSDIKDLENLVSFTMFNMPSVPFPKEILKLNKVKTIDLRLSDLAIDEYVGKYAKKTQGIAVITE